MSKEPLLVLGLTLLIAGCTREGTVQVQPASSQPGVGQARTYNSGFAQAHDTYNGRLAASDGKIYYILSSPEYDVAGQVRTTC